MIITLQAALLARSHVILVLVLQQAAQPAPQRTIEISVDQLALVISAISILGQPLVQRVTTPVQHAQGLHQHNAQHAPLQTLEVRVEILAHAC